MDKHTHETVEIRLPKEHADYIEKVAAMADVTRDQAASVIAVMALIRILPADEQDSAP